LTGRGHDGGVLNVARKTAPANPRTLRTTGRARLCFSLRGTGSRLRLLVQQVQSSGA